MNRLTLTRGGSGGATGSGYGGAIENEGTITLTNCTLRDNFASYGGAIDNYRGVVTLISCTLDNNFTPPNSGSGGVIDNFSGTVTLTQCTLTANSCADLGGAI